MTVPWYLTHKKYGNEPWAVQREALNRAEGKSRYGHFLEQGLGKTALILNEFMHAKTCGDVDLLLIVCPNSFKLSWVSALEEWGLLKLKAGIWPKSSPFEKDVYVMNWEAIRTEAGIRFLRQLKREVFLAYDETSYIANPSAQVTKKAIDVARCAKIVRILNGTPQTHSVVDYYGQLKCLNELNGYLLGTFKGHFAQIITQEVTARGGETRDIQTIVGSKNEPELAAILDRCSFRATKAEWRKDLPPRIISTIEVEMTPAQKRHYKEMKKEFITTVDTLQIKAELVLTQLSKLRQISSGIVIQNGVEALLEPIENNNKFSACFELFKAQSGKAIIVYNYKLTGKILRILCEKEGIKAAYLQGQMKPIELEEQKRLFNENSEYRIILCQQAAACMGHTLLGGSGADRCTTMIFAENSFSLRDRLQMLDRNHRGEQDQTCTVYDLVTSPVERKIIAALNAHKKEADLMDDLVLALREM